MDTQIANSLAHPLDVPAAIAKRRAMKSFKPDAIEPALLKRLIELTVSAPSSWNLQDWRIVMIQDEAQKAALSEAAWGQKQIVQAPVTFVFAADVTVGEKDLSPIHQQALQNGALNQEAVNYLKTAIPQFQAKLGDRRREYAIKDATIAATHLVLAAESFGLSSCFMNGWAEEKVKAVIGATDDLDLAIAVLVPIGYGAEERLNPGRLPFASNVFVDRIGNPYRG
ncbi:MAG: nitroreductase [Pseudanabaena sp. SU_2_4]|nr:nitroreductase [Pseudanabaena sp. SU_2_4]NKB17914.1 nitroreductase [Pseudanabaena sp. CRU_2_10]